MAKILSCAPNFSEGRDLEKVAQLKEIILSMPELNIALETCDPDHNRCAFEYYGEPEAVLEATVRLCRKAVELIDMNTHSGAHPRMGAVDVVPLVPIKDMTMEETVELSKELSKRIWEEVGIPVFLYERSASAEYRSNLGDIRKGQFEGMAEKIKLPEWRPDFGNAEIHPTAGVVAVGARMPMIAFNVNLDTQDVSIAKKIAKVVRFSSGGFKYVKAIGLSYKDMTQVSMDITDHTKVPLYRLLEVIRFEAERYNVHIASTEILGPCPMSVMVETAMYYMKNDGSFNEKDQIIEYRLM